jgi:class 3 adenylate cyclase
VAQRHFSKHTLIIAGFRIFEWRQETTIEHLERTLHVTAKTAVMVDLVAYSQHAALLEGELGVEATAMLNRQVQGLISQGLHDSRSPPDALVTDTGDGALLVFANAGQAVAFAQALQRACQYLFDSRQGIRRQFRIGIASGDIHIDRSGSGRSLAGMTIVTAARLEAKAPPGGVLIDASTRIMLAVKQADCFTGPETITGKRGETFDAWRWQVIGTVPDDQQDATLPTTDITRLINMDRASLMATIHARACALRREQFDLLILMSGIPNDRAPSPQANLAHQANELIRWASEAPEGLGELLEVVNSVGGTR